MTRHLDIIDPIHDFIRINENELKIIDHPIFQRLRRIRQLSGAHLTYPGAQHTRFEHSLGVMHIAGQAGKALKDKGLLKTELIEDLRVAALLHDIGHGPFSHLFEEILQAKTKFSHEDMGRQIILKTEIADILSKFTDKKFIVSLAFGESKIPYLNEIISGSLSADMMDYLQRDGYFTGAEHAKIDHKRITQSLEVYKKRLALEKSALYSFESMMHSRYQMFKAVYFHKTVRSAEVMLLESMKLADKEFGFTKMNLDNYIGLTDDTMISKITSIKSKNSELTRAKKFAQDYLDRKLLKCVFERILTRKTNLQKIKTESVRKKIAKAAKISESDIFVDSSITPSTPLSPSSNNSSSLILISKIGKKSIAKELHLSQMPMISSFEGFMNILRVYTFDKYRKKVEIAAQSILGGLK